MGTVLGILAGLVLVGGFAAFIDLVSMDNRRGYQPTGRLEGPPPNKGNCIQKNPLDGKRHKAPLMMQNGDFRKSERTVGVVYGEDAATWHTYIFKSCCGAEYFTDSGKLAGVVILPKEDKQ